MTNRTKNLLLFAVGIAFCVIPPAITALQKIDGLAEALAADAKAREIVIQSLNDQEDMLHTIVQSSDIAQFKKTDAEKKHLAHLAAIKELRAGKKPEEGGEDA